MGNRKKIRIVAVVASLVVATVVYFFISLYPRMPIFPECSLPQAEQETAIESLMARTDNFKVTEDEEKIVSTLEELHLIEAKNATSTFPKQRDEIMTGISNVRESVSTMAGLDRDRYLLLGDFLAREFHVTLMEFLSSSQKKGLIINQPKNTEAWKVIKKGGAFVSRSLRCGAIMSTGVLNTPTITPQVLFRVRWRHLADLRLDLDLSNVEKRAYHSFVAKYAEKTSTSRRLQAIQELKKLCPSFDAALARAIAMYEGGEKERAKREIRTALDHGRGTLEIRSLLRVISR